MIKSEKMKDENESSIEIETTPKEKEGTEFELAPSVGILKVFNYADMVDKVLIR